MANAAAKPGVLYWVISLVLLLWGLGGVSIYVAYFFLETPEEFAASAETAENAQAYAEYLVNVPAWAMAVAVAAAIARLLGALGLLLRRAWALPLYGISLVLFLAAMFRAFVLSTAGAVMNPGHIATEGVFVLLSVFAVWFAARNKAIGVLR